MWWKSLEHLDQSVFVVDSQTRLRFANKSARILLGATELPSGVRFDLADISAAWKTVVQQLLHRQASDRQQLAEIPVESDGQVRLFRVLVVHQPADVPDEERFIFFAQHDKSTADSNEATVATVLRQQLHEMETLKHIAAIESFHLNITDVLNRVSQIGQLYLGWEQFIFMFTEEDGFNPFDRMTQLRLGSHTRDMIARAKSEITDLRAHGLYLVDDLVLCHIQPRVGQSLWYVVQQPSQFRAGQEFFSSLSNQISELITRHHLARATMHDELTGLFNRSFLKSRIEVELRLAAARHRPLSALVLEPARHEALVRLHGEANAQRVLLRMAEVALDLVRDGDFAARLNESQLAILLPNTNDRDATALAQRFQERIAVDPIVMSPSPGHDHQVEIHPQIDFGVAEADLSDSSMDLLEEASKVLVLSRHTVRGAA